MKIALTLMATVAFAGAAQATTYSTFDWGVHDTLELAAEQTAVGGFEDTYLFTLPDHVQLYSSAVSINVNQVLGLSDGNVTLFREAGVVDSEVGSFNFGPASGNTTHGFGSPLAGDYYYRVTGMGTGSHGGEYTLTSTVTAVPEPGAAVMMLAGLGALLFMSKRRRQS